MTTKQKIVLTGIYALFGMALTAGIVFPLRHIEQAQSAGGTGVSTLQTQIQTIQSQIAELQAQLNATPDLYTYTRDLTVGSTGADVVALQTFLIQGRYSIPAGATGYFGAQTRSALVLYQKYRGIVPAVGYFGPVTRKSIGSND